MKVWIDAQLPPALARWLSETMGVEAVAVQQLFMRDSSDRELFLAARHHQASVMTKDRDFVSLLRALGPPPQVVWVRCGNTTNKRLREILSEVWPRVSSGLASGLPLIEITARE